MDSYSVLVVIFVASVMCLQSCFTQTQTTQDGFSTDMVSTLSISEEDSVGTDGTTDVVLSQTVDSAVVVPSQTVQVVEPSQTVEVVEPSQTVEVVEPSQTARTQTGPGPEGEPENGHTSVPKNTTEKSGSTVTTPHKYWPVISTAALIVITVL